MLGLPEKAFRHPESSKRLDEFQLADWLEGSITFAANSISQYDVADVLQENHLTSVTELQLAKNNATSTLESTWNELARRSKCLGQSSTYRVSKVRIDRVCDWQASPVFAFCLLVGLIPTYRSAFKAFSDYTEQGELFEQITMSALSEMGWNVHGVGWSKQGANSIAEKVEKAARFIGVDPLEDATEKWTAPKAKDAGLDVICQYVFADGWSGKPVILMQCASGENWEDKLHTPDINTWKKLVDFHTTPLRGLSMPFVVRPERFRRAAIRDALILLLDRNRLAIPHKLPTDWISQELASSLNRWMNQRVKILIDTAN
jgi:hypothetical protein